MVKHRYIAHLLQNASKVIDSGSKFTYVNVEHVVDQEQEEIEDLFAFLEIEMNQDVCSKWLDPKMLKK